MAYTLTAERPGTLTRSSGARPPSVGPLRRPVSACESAALCEPTLTRVALSDTGKLSAFAALAREGWGGIYFLGPLAVDPSEQAAGAGLTLVRDAVAACRANGGNGVILVRAERFFRQWASMSCLLARRCPDR